MSNMSTTMAQIFQQARTARIDGDYELAISLLQQVIAQEATFAAAHLELGLAYCFNGMFDESLNEMQQAVKLEENNAEMHLHLAKTYTMLGCYPEGEAEFRLVLTLSNPGDEEYDEANKQLSFFSDTC